MKKVSLPSIKVSRDRTTTSKVTRISKDDVLCHNVEKQRTALVPTTVKATGAHVHLSKTRDRIVEVAPENPFDVSDRTRVFTTRAKPSKLKPEPFIMGDIRTVVDVDPSFYEIIEGRPIRQFTDVKKYMREIRSITIFRTDSAFSKDRILAIEERQANENVEYEEVLKMFAATKKCFVKCVKQSYGQAKAAQIVAEKTALALADMVDQLEAVSFEYVKLRNFICHLGTNFDTLIYYARTLNSLAPPWWRDKFDYVNKIDTMSYVYVEQLNNMPQTLGQRSSSSLSTLDGYEITVVRFRGTPRLYLATPDQLIKKFVSFGEQCSNYMKIDGQTSVLRNNLTRVLTAMRKDLDMSVADMQDYVEMYTEKVQFHEEREAAYKKAFFKLLMGEFQDLFASYDNTKLFTCLQYVNTQLFGNPEDPKDTMVTLMSQLESYYLEVILDLEGLDQEVVKTATKISFERDIKEMNIAFKAKRVLKEFDILQRTLFTSFEPPRQRVRPEMKLDQTKKNKKGSKVRV